MRPDAAISRSLRIFLPLFRYVSTAPSAQLLHALHFLTEPQLDAAGLQVVPELVDDVGVHEVEDGVARSPRA